MIDGGTLVVVFRRLRRSSTHLAALATDKTNCFNTVGVAVAVSTQTRTTSTSIPFHSVHTSHRLQFGLCLDCHEDFAYPASPHVSKASGHWSLKVGIISSQRS